MNLRYPGACRLCRTGLPAGAQAIYERGTKTVRCVACAVGPEPVTSAAFASAGVSDTAEPPPSVGQTGPSSVGPSPIDPGVAGSSARREFDRRKAADEECIRARWGRFGGFAVALVGDRQSTTAWQRGAVGEERLGAVLDRVAAPEVAVLHDRQIPGSRANIDHLVVTRSAIWVIDAKRYQGRPCLLVEGGILRPRTEKLLVGRRDCTGLVDGVLTQVDVVRRLIGDVPLVPALCFVDADWPLIGGAFRTRGVQILWPKLLATRIGGPESQERGSGLDVAAVHALLAARLKPA